MLARAAVSSEAWLGKDRLQVHLGCWQSSSLCNSRTEITTPLPTVIQGPLLAPTCEPHGGLPYSPFYKLVQMVAYFLKASKSLSFYLSSLLEQFYIMKYNHRWHPITFAIFDWLEASNSSCTHSRGGAYTKMWTPGNRILLRATMGSVHHNKQKTQYHSTVGSSVLWQEWPETQITVPISHGGLGVGTHVHAHTHLHTCSQEPGTWHTHSLPSRWGCRGGPDWRANLPTQVTQGDPMLCNGCWVHTSLTQTKCVPLWGLNAWSLRLLFLKRILYVKVRPTWLQMHTQHVY